MIEGNIEIASGGVLLGTLSTQDALELLEGGFLLGDDQYRASCDEPWKPLASLVPVASNKPDVQTHSWISRAGEVLTTTRERVSKTAGEAAQTALRLAGATRAKLQDESDAWLNAFRPQIQKLVDRVVQSKSVVVLRASIHDDVFMTKVFGAAYDLLPKSVCRFVSESQFLTFCLKHRDSLIRSNDAPGGGSDCGGSSEIRT